MDRIGSGHVLLRGALRESSKTPCARPEQVVKVDEPSVARANKSAREASDFAVPNEETRSRLREVVGACNVSVSLQAIGVGDAASTGQLAVIPFHVAGSKEHRLERHVVESIRRTRKILLDLETPRESITDCDSATEIW